MAESKTIDLRCDTCGAIVTLLVADVGQQGFAVGNPRGLVCPFDQHYDDHAHHGYLTRLALDDDDETDEEDDEDAGNRAPKVCRYCGHDEIQDGDIGADLGLCYQCSQARDAAANAALAGLLDRASCAELAYAHAHDMMLARRKAPPP